MNSTEYFFVIIHIKKTHIYYNTIVYSVNENLLHHSPHPYIVPN